MRAVKIEIKRFRGIKAATIILPKHAVLIGDNNTGKTTVLEALDLTLGPDRLNRFPPIDEHDFYQGQYLAKPDDDKAPAAIEEPLEAEPLGDEAAQSVDAETKNIPRIEVEVVIVDLSEDQRARFGDYIEFWDTEENKFYNAPKSNGIEPSHITEALRVTFHGWYEVEEDDFDLAPVSPDT